MSPAPPLHQLVDLNWSLWKSTSLWIVWERWVPASLAVHSFKLAGLLAAISLQDWSPISTAPYVNAAWEFFHRNLLSLTQLSTQACLKEREYFGTGFRCRRPRSGPGRLPGGGQSLPTQNKCNKIEPKWKALVAINLKVAKDKEEKMIHNYTELLKLIMVRYSKLVFRLQDILYFDSEIKYFWSRIKNNFTKTITIGSRVSKWPLYSLLVSVCLSVCLSRA